MWVKWKGKKLLGFQFANSFGVGGKMRNYFKSIFGKEETRTDAQFPRLNISSQETIHGIENPMNNSIVPNRETSSQSTKPEKPKKKSKQNEKERLVSVEQNVERFAKFGLFCTTNSREVGSEVERVIDLGTEISEEGTVAKKIVITPSAKYGYPTVGALEVLEGIHYLHSQDPKTDIVVIPSIKFFITKILKRKYSDHARDAFLRNISELFDTSFTLEHCFYSKDKKDFEEELIKFHLLEDLNLRRRKTKDVVRESSSVKLNKHVYENIKLNYTKPFYIDTAFKIRSEIGKLLYRMLCFHFSHHDKFNYSTKKIFEQLNLKGEDYIYASARKRLLERAVKQIVNQPISLSKLVVAYEFQKSVDDSDWNLLVLAAKSQKALNNKLSVPKLSDLPQGAVEAHREPSEGQPRETIGKEKGLPIQANTVVLEGDSKQGSKAEEKSELKKLKVTPYVAFITLFVERFPKAKSLAELKKMHNVRNNATKFLKHFSLEQATEFLDYAREAGDDNEMILEAETPNYLFSGGKNSVYEAWQRKKYSDAEAAKQAERVEDLVWSEYTKTRRAEYTQYFDSIVDGWSEELQVKFSLFHEEYAEEQLRSIEAKNNRPLNGGMRHRAKQAYLGELFMDSKIKAFCLREGLEVPPVKIEEWINAFYREDYEAYRKQRLSR